MPSRVCLLRFRIRPRFPGLITTSSSSRSTPRRCTPICLRLPCVATCSSTMAPDATTGMNTVAPPAQSYLGPVIIAQKDRPVRVVFKNMLPTGPGGNLFIPVDTTYMGAGAPYTQNRATLHLHGGATPWISDGTPHQWTSPAGEAGPARGDSVALVPDMWFDGYRERDHQLLRTAYLRSAGSYQRSRRRRADVLLDQPTGWPFDVLPRPRLRPHPAERLCGRGCGLPVCTIRRRKARFLTRPSQGRSRPTAGQTAPDLAHLIPLVIQDKTFVPSQKQLMAQDPTWAGNFGLTPLNNTTTNGNGDLVVPARLHAEPEPQRHNGGERLRTVGLRSMVLPTRRLR